MALQMTLTIKLSDGTTVTKTAPAILANPPYNNGQEFAQWLGQQGGFFDDTGAYHPTSAVVSITFA